LYVGVFGREELVHGLINASSAGVPYALSVTISNVDDRVVDRRSALLRGGMVPRKHSAAAAAT
jgi:hypothetical protein